ncbi:glycoprotein family protein m04 [Murid betaherpesvirus 1]|uniref:Glycoprotein family protein m04 n=4 Tax=Muromegalovirus muridbeta1 TaxID=3050323 RepID=D3XDI8_MUHVS|nr:glycoprotein family protein m04 [Murid betaherpesvirus 1]ABM74005.1 m04/gp34 protein [Murid betaherpesvirus 1]ADD10382.1 glycoprotein family protein m04 [Murid betaherpesvirus 1]CAJ84725.1 m04 protein [Murid betaherpesvirus 1]CAP08048.1 gp34 [Murine cytomegalovirus (strain K181)]
MSLTHRPLLVIVIVSVVISFVGSYNNDQCKKDEEAFKKKMQYRHPLGCYFKGITPTKIPSKGDTLLTCKLPDVKVNASWTLEWVVVKLQNSVDVTSYYESSPNSEPRFLRAILNFTPIHGLRTNNLLTVKDGFQVDNSTDNGNGGNLYVYSNASTGSADSVRCRLRMCPWTSNSKMTAPDEEMLRKMSEVLNLPNYGVPDLTPPRRDEFYTKNESPNTIVTTLTVIVTLLFVGLLLVLIYLYGPSLYRRFFSNDCCSNFKPLKSN